MNEIKVMSAIDVIENANITDLSKKQIKEQLKIKTFDKPSVVSLKGHFNFNAMEEDMVNYFLYYVNKVDTSNPYVYTIKFNCNDIIKFYEMNKSSKIYETIKNSFKKVRDKSIWWYEENEKTLKQKSFYFFYDVECETRKDYKKIEKNKQISSEINIKIEPKNYHFLLKLIQEYFTKFDIQCIHRLENVYSKRLYEMLYDNHTHKEAEYIKNKKPVPKYFQYILWFSDLRKRFCIENKYKDNKNFIKNIIKKPVREINNNYNNLTILYKITNEKVIFLTEKKDYDGIRYEEETKRFEEIVKIVKEQEEKDSKGWQDFGGYTSKK